MAPLSAQLLPQPVEADAAATGRGCGRPLWRRAAAAAAASGCALLFAGAEFGRSAPHDSAAHSISLSALDRSSLRTNATSLSAGLNADCYTFTGVFCKNLPCASNRNAECEDWRCMCVTTGCAGVDGACHPGMYRTVGLETGFELYNGKFSWQHMYMPSLDIFQRVKVTAAPTWLGMGRDKWVLHELPGASKPKAYFLGTVAYPSWVANIRPTQLAISAYGAYETALVRENAPNFLAVRVCSLGAGKIKIGSYREPVEWFYVHHGSWNVYGWGLTDDPSDGGYWLPDPPLPDAELEACG